MAVGGGVVATPLGLAGAVVGQYGWRFGWPGSSLVSSSSRRWASSWLSAWMPCFTRSWATFPLCCPSRATNLTGQYAHNHGRIHNNPPEGRYGQVHLPTPTASWLQQAGYRTALLGKAHFEPNFDPGGRFEENARARRGTSKTMVREVSICRIDSSHQ